MRRMFFTFSLCLISAVIMNAQSLSNDRFSVSVDLGAGRLFGHSNLSSYGVNYRGEYKSGFSGNVKASYLLNKVFQAGLKFNLFSTSGNYNLAQDTQVADDLDLIYIAPQIGYRTMISEKWSFDCMAGAGYMHYKSLSLHNQVERECSKGFLGVNADLSFARQLYRNLYIGANISVTGGHTSSLKETIAGKEETLTLDKWNRIKVLRTDVMLSLKVLL